MSLVFISEGCLKENIDFILSHFRDQLHPFPRKMMTYGSDGQFTVKSREDILKICQQANYKDCKINAYPEYTHYENINRTPPSFLFVDLDLENCDNDIKRLTRVKDTTIENIKNKINGSPTVLWSGGGFHIYQPVKLTLRNETKNITLESIDIFDKFLPYVNHDLTTECMRFMSKYFSKNKSDKKHKPSISSCLIRIPGTINSKHEKENEVKVLQAWDGNYSSINYILKDFEIYLIQKRMDVIKEKNKQSKTVLRKNNNAGNMIYWIEKLLQTPINDNRYYCLWHILIPYLVNIKGISNNEEINKILMNWLDECNKLRSLSFDPKNRIKYILKGVKDFAPISQSKLKEDNPDLYRALDIHKIFLIARNTM